MAYSDNLIARGSLLAHLFKITVAGLLFALMSPSAAFGQEEDPASRARKAIDAAVEALGGQAYLDTTAIHATGNWFAFDEHGRRSPLLKYREWIEYSPIKWYFQLGEKGRQQVSVYNLELKRAWKKEGKNYVEELSEKDVEGFQRAAKHDIDVILKLRANDEDVSLFYYGPDDISGGGHYEAVELVDSANDSVVVYFNLKSKRPERLEYHVRDKLGNRVKNSDEFYNWHTFSGVILPMRIDSLREGSLYQQKHLIEVSVNPIIPPGQFLEPQPEDKDKAKKK